jgi:uncharacterized membrane protein YdjX (TVP38/TMEM64 family)
VNIGPIVSSAPGSTSEELAPATTWRKLGQLVRAIGPVALVVVVLEITLSAGLAAHFMREGQLESLVRGAGLWAPVVFIALMASLVPLNVPGLLFVVPATSLFGVASGILLSLTGGFLASTIGILGARYLARPVFERRLPPWLRSWEARMAERAFWTIVLLRSVTFLLQPVDWICGLSRVPTRRVLAATFIGLIPPTVTVALTGGGLIDLLA